MITLTDRDPQVLLAGEVAQHITLHDRVALAWGMRVIEVLKDRARISMEVRADMLNALSLVHGGVIFALADVALAYAANAKNLRAATQQASICFLGPARAGDTLVAEASELMVQGRSGVYSVVVRTADGRDIAALQGSTRLLGGHLLPEKDSMGDFP
jgi:acyl-CoA thioesterase